MRFKYVLSASAALGGPTWSNKASDAKGALLVVTEVHLSHNLRGLLEECAGGNVLRNHILQHRFCDMLPRSDFTGLFSSKRRAVHGSVRRARLSVPGRLGCGSLPALRGYKSLSHDF